MFFVRTPIFMFFFPGHRLVLSNQSKKWISADGVEKIQTVSEVKKIDCRRYFK